MSSGSGRRRSNLAAFAAMCCWRCWVRRSAELECCVPLLVEEEYGLTVVGTLSCGATTPWDWASWSVWHARDCPFWVRSGPEM